MQQAGLNQDAVLEATSWQDAQSYLEQNATDILKDGHWGVPLMVYEGEPFYGQDRFDHLQWRMKENGVI
jgi:2-hydroxychromene-2-carboxylate isomerase